MRLSANTPVLLRALVTAACAVLCGCGASNFLGREVRVEEHPFQHGDHELSYWVGTPVFENHQRADRGLPIAVFVEGDGSKCSDYSSSSWQRFVKRWAGDYVLVRPRTYVNTVCGEDAFRAADFAHRVDELAALVDKVRRDLPAAGEHGERRLYLIGHSAGAHVAGLYAAAHPNAISGLVDLGGSLEPLRVVVREVARARQRAGDIDRAELDKTLASLDRDEADLTAHPTSPEPFWGRSKRFFAEMFFATDGAFYRSTTLPVFVGHGERDLEAVPASLVHAEEQELRGRPNLHFVFYPDLGHDLVEREVFRDVNAWIGEEERRATAAAAKIDAAR